MAEKIGPDAWPASSATTAALPAASCQAAKMAPKRRHLQAPCRRMRLGSSRVAGAAKCGWLAIRGQHG